ncbi:hypothetical protein ACJX0J_030756, partial [Zea mays]
MHLIILVFSGHLMVPPAGTTPKEEMNNIMQSTQEKKQPIIWDRDAHNMPIPIRANNASHDYNYSGNEIPLAFLLSTWKEMLWLERLICDTLDIFGCSKSIKISQHKKPKKLNVARVVSEGNIFRILLCTPEDVNIYIYNYHIIHYIFLYFQRCIGVLEASAYPTVYHTIVLIHLFLQRSEKQIAIFFKEKKQKEQFVFREIGHVHNYFVLLFMSTTLTWEEVFGAEFDLLPAVGSCCLYLCVRIPHLVWVHWTCLLAALHIGDLRAVLALHQPLLHLLRERLPGPAAQHGCQPDDARQEHVRKFQ